MADQDDIWLPEKLEQLLAGIGEASLVYSDAFLIDDTGKELPGSLMGTSGVLPVTGNDFSHFVCNSCVTGCTVMFRRDLLEVALPIPKCESYHDWWLALVASKRCGVSYLPQRLVRYRQHAHNQAGVSRKSGLVSRIRAHLGRETRRRKAQYYRLLRERGGLLPTMRERLELTDGEMAFLHDMERYGCGLLDTRPHLSLVFLAWRHRKNLFPAASPLQRLFFVTSSLFKYISIRPGDQNASQ